MEVLDAVTAAVGRALERAAEGAFGIAAAEELAHLLAEGVDLAVGDRGEGRVERGGIEVGGGFGVEEVDVDRAPVVVEGCVGDLLDDGHGGLVGWRKRGGSVLR